jgi:hypothetical protein
MIFTVDQGDIYTNHYIKDDKGLIIGSVQPYQGGWAYQSCLINKIGGAWSKPEIGDTKQDAINAAIADYIARRME